MIPPGVFRLMLATLVVLAHFTKLGMGTAAVNLFFILSGFWVYRMFNSKYERARYPGLLFVASRALRIYPVFLLFNIAAFLLHWALNDDIARSQTLLDIVPNTLIIGYSSLPSRPLGPAWSLDLEMQFYLLFPIIFSMLGDLARHTKAILALMLGLGGLYIAFFIDSDVGAASVMPYTGFFLLGMFAARNNWKPANRLAYASALAWALGLAAIIVFPAVRGFVIHAVNQDQFTWNPAVNVVAALVAAPIALASVYAKSTPRDRIVGDLSYVVYCSHWLGVIVAGHYLADFDKLHKSVLIFGLIALTYLGSLLVLLYFDRPISRWRESWVARRLMVKVGSASSTATYGHLAVAGAPGTQPAAGSDFANESWRKPVKNVEPQR